VRSSAKNRGNFSTATLTEYRSKLEKSFILNDMKHFKKSVSFLHDNPQFLNLYPKATVDFLIDYFTVDSTPKDEVWKKAYGNFKSKVSLWKFVIDAIKAKGALK